MVTKSRRTIKAGGKCHVMNHTEDSADRLHQEVGRKVKEGDVPSLPDSWNDPAMSPFRWGWVEKRALRMDVMAAAEGLVMKGRYC